MFRTLSKIHLALTAVILLSGAFFMISPALAAISDMPEEAVENGYTDDHEAQTAHGDEHVEIETGAQHSGGLPQLDPSTWASQAFWVVVMFIVMYFFFSKGALPSISNTIENRKNHIDSDLETAEKLTAEADAVHDDYQANLTKAQEEAARVVQDVEAEMKEKSAKAFEKFRKRSEQEIQAAEERILESKNAAMNEMNTIAAEAAAQAVEKIIGQSPDVNQVKSVVENINGDVKAKAA